MSHLMLFIMNEAGSECKGEQGEKEILDKQEGKMLKERKNSVYQKRGIRKQSRNNWENWAVLQNNGYGQMEKNVKEKTNVQQTKKGVDN